MIKSVVAGFCFIGVWYYSEWCGWDLITLAQFEVRECLQGNIKTLYKNLKILPLMVEHSVVVMSARLNPMGSQFLILVWRNLSSELVGDTDTGSASSVSVRMKYVFAFEFWYCELRVENRWGGGRKHCFVNFCSLAELE